MSGKVLIIDDVMTTRIVMKVKLTSAGYALEVASSGSEGLRLAGQFRPDVILVNDALTDMPLAQFMAEMAKDPRLQGIIVMAISANGAAEARLAAFTAGCDEVMVKPVSDAALLSRLRNYMRARAELRQLDNPYGMYVLAGMSEADLSFEMPMRLAIFPARAMEGVVMAHNLAPLLPKSVEIVQIDSSSAGAAKTNAPREADIYIIAADAASGSAAGGLRLMAELRGRSANTGAKFCILQPNGADPLDVDMAFDLGADCVIERDQPAEEVALRLGRLMARKRLTDMARRHIDDAMRLAVIDPLTGIHNRRYAHAQLAQIVADSAQTKASFAVMVVDIDRFKSVNDRFGHGAGDTVIRAVADALRSDLRMGDLLARIGGEEFLIALPHVSLGEARAVAERITQDIRAMRIEIETPAPISVTVSVGLSLAITEPDADPDEFGQKVIAAADEALMTSKAQGRNKVTLGRSAA